MTERSNPTRALPMLELALPAVAGPRRPTRPVDDRLVEYLPESRALPRFLNALPTRFEVGEGAVVFNATQIDIDPASGRALAIERIQRLVEI